MAQKIIKATMRNKIIIFALIVGIGGALAIFFAPINQDENGFTKRREKVLGQLYLAIEKTEIDGKYKCCIEPPCTMCYLGEWIWEDGTCDCDTMIKQGEWDKVCPQCVKGIKEGKCESASDDCPIL